MERLEPTVAEASPNLYAAAKNANLSPAETTQINQLSYALKEHRRLSKLPAETAKQHAENDLDVLQKKTQFELINTIVKVALYVIIGVGLTTTALYTVALFTDQDTHIIGSTWSNMFGILLTNAFSIVGTIMGVKYASEKPKKG